ncbi:MAG: hypothetical protein U1E30_05085 [Rhodoblastus sp.]
MLGRDEVARERAAEGMVQRQGFDPATGEEFVEISLTRRIREEILGAILDAPLRSQAPHPEEPAQAGVSKDGRNPHASRRLPRRLASMKVVLEYHA